MNASRKIARLVLGTAQLGLPYGAANRIGMPSEDDAAALLAAALAAGVRAFDTARAYGESERRLGRALAKASDVTIVTKLDPLAQLPADAPPDQAAVAARASLDMSRAALGRTRLDVVLLHRAEHRTQWGGAVWRCLAEERRANRIGALGISAQSPVEVAEALQDPLVRHLQLPFNLLDWRWSEADTIAQLRNRPDVTVHVRSVFLQGLLATEAAGGPAPAGGGAARGRHDLDRLVRQTSRVGRADLCLAFVRAQDWIDGVVIGCETTDQLQDNLDLFRRDALSREDLDAVIRARPRVAADLLDPARWPATA